jgi:hypothetical protein
MAELQDGGVVLRYRDGRATRCTLAEAFAPDADIVEVITEDGERTDVEVSDLKAVFFLKNPRQRHREMTLNERAGEEPVGAVAKVEFFDGEIMRGRVQQYSVANRGFYLYPTALESNNERVFVVALALTTVSIEEG